MSFIAINRFQQHKFENTVGNQRQMRVWACCENNVKPNAPTALEVLNRRVHLSFGNINLKRVMNHSLESAFILHFRSTQRTAFIELT